MIIEIGAASSQVQLAVELFQLILFIAFRTNDLLRSSVEENRLDWVLFVANERKFVSLEVQGIEIKQICLDLTFSLLSVNSRITAGTVRFGEFKGISLSVLGIRKIVLQRHVESVLNLSFGSSTQTSSNLTPLASKLEIEGDDKVILHLAKRSVIDVGSQVVQVSVADLLAGSSSDELANEGPFLTVLAHELEELFVFVLLPEFADSSGLVFGGARRGIFGSFGNFFRSLNYIRVFSIIVALITEIKIISYVDAGVFEGF